MPICEKLPRIIYTFIPIQHIMVVWYCHWSNMPYPSSSIDIRKATRKTQENIIVTVTFDINGRSVHVISLFFLIEYNDHQFLPLIQTILFALNILLSTIKRQQSTLTKGELRQAFNSNVWLGSQIRSINMPNHSQTRK